jgi:acetyltransferase-like isoleucine patch superfamily enzyme
MITSFYTQDELQTLGLKSYGKNVLISKKTSIYNPFEISIRDHVRIDDFCILSGNIELGSYIHIAAYCAVYGSHGVVIEDYVGLSPRATVFSATDDFSGNYLAGPMIEEQYRNITGKIVRICKYAMIGAASVVLPGVCINEGSSVGALSLVNKDLESWGMYAGIPVKRIKDRSKRLLELSALIENNPPK